MFTLTAPAGISQFQGISGAFYTVSPAGTISVPLSDLQSALAAGFTQVSGAASSPFSTKTISGAAGALTLTTTYTALFVDCSAGPASFTLPAAGTPGRTVVQIDFTGNAGTNNITATGTINGQSSFVTNVNYASYTFVDNGTSWNIT